MKIIAVLARVLLAIGAIVLFFYSSTWTSPAFASVEKTALVRIVHASPDVGTVDVFVDGTRQLSSFQFATVTGYVPLPAGSHKVQIALIGKGLDAAILAQAITVQPNLQYTVAVLGTKASGFSFTIFIDDNIVSGNATKLRVYHLSPGTKPVNVNEDSATIIQGLGYKEDSGYISISAGQHTFDLSGLPQNAANSFSVTIKPWTVTSVFVIGLLTEKAGLQYVNAQVNGIPGMPHTGSDPRTQVEAANSTPTNGTASISPVWFWLTGVLSMGILFVCIWLSRNFSSRSVHFASRRQ